MLELYPWTVKAKAKTTKRKRPREHEGRKRATQAAPRDREHEGEMREIQRMGVIHAQNAGTLIQDNLMNDACTALDKAMESLTEARELAAEMKRIQGDDAPRRSPRANFPPRHLPPRPKKDGYTVFR